MTVPIHSFRDLRHSTLSLILLVLFAGIAGCSTDDSPGVGSSPPDWVVVPSGGKHAKSATLTYIANGGSSSCIECHGADLSGGTSAVSCFGNSSNCHHGPVADWVVSPPASQSHGVAAKKAPGNSGFASCQICHGSDFTGGGAEVSCFTCHGVSAPHAPKPWRASGETGYTHTTTDPENAPVCALCHFPGSPNNPANHPSIPAETGTAPGCLNNTLCHGEGGAPHPVGSDWVAASPAAQPHGNSAKATPGVTAGFAYCRVCHGTGTDFSGGSSGVSCHTCHVPTVNSPHASQWRTGGAYVHTSTAEGNASECAFCHLNGANSPIGPPSPPAPEGTAPGCFNGTLCHGTGSVQHPVPYNDNSHSTITSATFPGDCGVCHDLSAPSAKAGPVCQTCHVADSPFAAADCASCHADPPDGAAYPNVAGKHAIHRELRGVEGCTPCHNRLDAGTPEHYDRANARPGKDALRVPPGDVAFLAAYDAKSGTAAFSPANRTCSNVICHGGQTTPDWQTETANAIDVPNACLNCHISGTTQYNSYHSGRHGTHIDIFGSSASTCKRCHDQAKVNVSGHFQNLATPAFEQPASETILPAVQYSHNSCNPKAGKLTGCHGIRNW